MSHGVAGHVNGVRLPTMKLLPSAADQSLREKTESPVRNPTPSLQIHVKEIYLILFVCSWCLLESADTVVL